MYHREDRKRTSEPVATSSAKQNEGFRGLPDPTPYATAQLKFLGSQGTILSLIPTNKICVTKLYKIHIIIVCNKGSQLQKVEDDWASIEEEHKGSTSY